MQPGDLSFTYSVSDRLVTFSPILGHSIKVIFLVCKGNLQDGAIGSVLFLFNLNWRDDTREPEISQSDLKYEKRELDAYQPSGTFLV